MIYGQLQDLIIRAKVEVTEKWINYVKENPDALHSSINIVNKYDDDITAAIIAVLSTGNYDWVNKEFNFREDKQCMHTYLNIRNEMQDPNNYPYWVPVVNGEGNVVFNVNIIYKDKELKNWRHPKNDNL